MDLRFHQLRGQQNQRGNRRDLSTFPPEILHQILKLVCENGLIDFVRAKSTCKTLTSVGETPELYIDVDLFVLQAPNYPITAVTNFKNLCVHHQNPSALFCKGTSKFFKEGRLTVGLEQIRLSAIGGYDLGRYAYTLIYRILNQGTPIVDPLANLSRAYVRRVRVQVGYIPDIAWPMFEPRPPLYDNMVNLIPVEDVYNCSCSPTRRWPRAWEEACKAGKMCDVCFWTCQMSWFSREFPRKILSWPSQHHDMNPRL